MTFDENQALFKEYEKLQAELTKEGVNEARQDEITQRINDIKSEMSGIPGKPLSDLDMDAAGKQSREEFAAGEVRKEQAQDVANITGFAKDVYKIGQSASQIRKSKKTLEELQGQKPQYVPPSRSPRLQQRLGSASEKAGSGFTPSTLGTLHAQNLDTYRQNIQNAKTASGGQGGVFGSMAQGAALNRYGANRQIAMADENMRRQNESQYDNLLRVEQSERGRADAQNYRNFTNEQLNYNEQLRNAQALGLAGRQNMSANLEQLPSTLGNMVSTYGLPKSRQRQVEEIQDTPLGGPTGTGYIQQQPPISFPNRLETPSSFPGNDPRIVHQPYNPPISFENRLPSGQFIPNDNRIGYGENPELDNFATQLQYLDSRRPLRPSFEQTTY